MKSFKTLAATLIALAMTQAASAIIISSVSINTSGESDAIITFDGFAVGAVNDAAVIAPDLTFSSSNAFILGSSIPSQGAIPQPEENLPYLSIYSQGFASFAFSSVQDRFAFQWGSVDSYNSVNFFLGGNPILVDGSFTGTNIIDPANGFQGSTGSAYVVFSGLFDTVVLSSSGFSFEIDNIASRTFVPDAGSSLALLGLALVGLAGFARRHSV